MIRLIAGRLVSGVVVMLVVGTVAFFMIRAAPGSPFDQERKLPPEIERNQRAQLHMDEPLVSQWLIYMGNLVQLDFGYSTTRTETVNETIAESFPKSAQLGALALAFAISLGVLLGVVAAVKQNTWADHGLMGLALLGISIPAFVLAPLLIGLFTIQLMWLPPARFDSLSSMILPAATLGMIFMGVIARLARSGLLETLRQDYIRTARSKGLSHAAVVMRHALRLGLIPVVTYLGPAIAALITGSFIVELIFQIPGLGWYFVQSVNDRDYPMLGGVLVVYSGFIVVLNLLVDISYGLLDPRVRSGR